MTRPRTLSLVGGIALCVVVLVALVHRSGAVGSAATTSDRRRVPAIEEPACADWISECARSARGYEMMGATTLPRAFDVVGAGAGRTTHASNLLSGEPTISSSADGTETVTYHLNPRAVWSDGEPITSADLKYTSDEINSEEHVRDATGYDRIVSIDDSDPSVAVVVLREPYGAWKELFGGADGILPKHLLEGTDRSAAMKDGYSWSGGPWIATWDKGVAVTLRPNERYWGARPPQDSIVYSFTRP